MHEPMVGRSAPRPAEVGILIGRIRSLVVKTWTIGIEAPLTTTPENEQTLAGYGEDSQRAYQQCVTSPLKVSHS